MVDANCFFLEGKPSSVKMGFMAEMINKTGIIPQIFYLGLSRGTSETFQQPLNLLQIILENHLMAKCVQRSCGVEDTHAPAGEGAKKRGPFAARKGPGYT